MTRLDEQLGVPKLCSDGKNQYLTGGQQDWTVRECLSIWWRPHFDTFLVSVKGILDRPAELSTLTSLLISLSPRR